MSSPSTVCVYCGSSADVAQVYRDTASNLGRLLGERGIGVVYGGGRVGLMGLVADAVLAGGGRVTGIIPGHLHDQEVGHTGLSELIVTDNMHNRKKRMFDVSDAFAVLPGGLGTLDETFEIVTWRQLNLHDKPVIIVDVAGYWAPLKALLDQTIAAGFAPAHAHSFFRFVDGVDDVLGALAEAPAPSRVDNTKLA